MDYVELARQKALQYGLDPDLFVRQIQAESAFRPNAVSSAGAIGLGQLMPATARELGVDPSNPAQNLDGAARYMKQQLDTFGNYPMALAAYNAGPSRVQKAGGIPNITETQNYVSKIMGAGGSAMNANTNILGAAQAAEEEYKKEQASKPLFQRDSFKDIAGDLAVAFNSMRLKPDDNIVRAVESIRTQRTEAKARNKTLEMMTKIGRDDLAAAVQSGALTAKEAYGQMLSDAAKVRDRQASMVDAMTLEAFKTSLAAGVPAKPLTQIAKLKTDYENGRITKEEYDAALASTLSKNKMSIRQNPDGTFEFAQGTDLPKRTEAQSKDINWAVRMQGALADFEPIAAELTSIVGNLAQLDPTKLSRYMQSDDFQRAVVAGKEFLAPLVRKDTGAAVTNKEWELYSDIYIPQVGDGAAKLEQKAIARRRALAALQAGLPPDFVLSEQYAGRNPLESAGQGVGGGSSANAVPNNAVTIGGYVIEPINGGSK